MKNGEIIRARQIHLDFHTSEAIANVGASFDPDVFAKELANAGVNSVTVFARCHHGWLYYDSKAFPEAVHPGLVCRNLLLEQVQACHRAGIRAPIYVTVQWDYRIANTRPEWLIRARDGSHTGSPFDEAGFYQSLCLNTPYLDYLKAVTAEVCELLGDDLDGFFFDIVGVRPCWCSVCRPLMDKAGIDAHDEDAVRAFTKAGLDKFKTELSAFVRGYSADCTVFYNAGHIGPCTRASADAYSHYELESLPSGFWGYLHFPATARYARTSGKPCLGMTGKFHTAWGDFHSLKNIEALEFECFQMLSHGFACSIGDQLEPSGVLQPAAYRLIGSVYNRVKEIEQYCLPASPVAECAVFTTESPLGELVTSDEIFGATQMLQELAVQFDIVDRESDLSGYKLLMLPDDVSLTGDRELADRLNAYIKNGGKVLATYKSGVSDGELALGALAGTKVADEELWPTFIEAKGALGASLEDMSYVHYMRGYDITPCAGAETLLGKEAPFFTRSGKHFCSHMYTPSTHKNAGAAAIGAGGVVYFGHPLFAQYRAIAPRWIKLFVRNTIAVMLGRMYTAHSGPSTVILNLTEQLEHSRYILHALNYIPVRKSASIDLIEEKIPLYELDVTLNLPKRPRTAFIRTQDAELALREGSDGVRLTIPEIGGYQIVEITY